MSKFRALLLFMIATGLGVSVALFQVLIFPARQPASENYDPEKSAAAIWSIDPAVHGADAPPAGRSNFDKLIATASGDTAVPYPFTALLKKIRGVLAPMSGDLVSIESGLLGVMIPHGRSLQRNTPFYAPRTVVAVTGEPLQAKNTLGLMLQNRLFIGFSEEKQLLEVISYNEDAARFEYQIVKDYKAGATPQVFYAARAVCVQCHQNQGPIFSEADWKETNSFDRVANELDKAFRAKSTAQIKDSQGQASSQFVYQGVPLRITDAMPYTIDQAIGEADLFGAYQKVWQESCEGTAFSAARCRSLFLRSVLRFALTKQLTVNGADEAQWTEVLLRSWLTHWPQGIKIPDQHIPNRDPFVDVRSVSNPPVSLFALNALPADDAQTIRNSTVPLEFEPLNPRNPSMVWNASTEDRSDINGVITGLSRHFTSGDRKMLDQRLFEMGQTRATHSLHADCQTFVIENGLMKLSCSQPLETSLPTDLAIIAGDIALRPNDASSNSLIISAGAFVNRCSVDARQARSNPRSCKATANGTIERDGDTTTLTLRPRETTENLHFRFSDGNAVNEVQVVWSARQPAKASVTIHVLDDFQYLQSALDQMATDQGPDAALSAKSFRRNAILSTLFSKLGSAVSVYPFAPTSPIQVEQTSDFDEVAQMIAADSRLKPFFESCQQCHDNSVGQPSNWLRASSVSALTQQIAACRERLYYRVTRWDHSPAKDGAVQEMPPRQSVKDLAAWTNNRKQILNYLLQSMQLSADQAQRTVLSQSYESLAPCRSEVE